MDSWYEPNKEVNFNADCRLPEEVTIWLAGLRLLYNVPFPYLAPDERMLSPESIAFFCVDETWIDALTDGALSIGRNTAKDAQRDFYSAPLARTDADEALAQPRIRKTHKKRRVLMKTQTSTGSLSGFIIRSQIVSHWRGIEVTASAGKTPLTILRMEALSDELMICIFDGKPDSVTFTEPTEALHFGTRDNKRIINVRSIEEGKIGKPAGTCAVPHDENGRVKVLELTKNLQKILGSGELNSAHLALEMLSVADICSFKEGVKP